MQNTNDGVLNPIPAPKTIKKVNMSHQVKERRRRVITRLEEQLKLGTKPEKGLTMDAKMVIGNTSMPLTDKDITRIKKEIETLKGRI